jgi:HSP20 family protein
MKSNQEVAKMDRESRSAAEDAALLPPVDVFEDEHGITVLADLPGVAKEDLSIGVDGDTLTIEGQVKLGEARQLNTLHAEVRAPLYRRSFTLSRELDTGNIEASLKDGVLRLTVPKTAEAKPRRIEVRAD